MSNRSSARKARTLSFVFPPTVSRPELLDGGDDRRFRQFVYDLSVLTSHIDAVRALLASRVGLTPPQYNIIMVVAQYQESEPVTVGTVAAHLHVSSAFVAMETNKLVRQQLLTKEPNPLDGRGVLLKVTESAQAAIRDLAPHLCAVNDKVFGSLDRDDFKRLSAGIARMIDDAFAARDELSLEQRSLQRAQRLPVRTPQARRRLRASSFTR